MSSTLVASTNGVVYHFQNGEMGGSRMRQEMGGRQYERREARKVVRMTVFPPQPRTLPLEQVQNRGKHSLKPMSVPYEMWVRKSLPKKSEASKLEVIKHMETWAVESLLPLLNSVEKNWQPQDYLPSFSSPDFYDQIIEIQKRTANLPDDYLVVLVGDMITEEALPTYQNLINTLDGTRDLTACSPSPWATWLRGWTSEENRHGDLLSNYLYISGKVDMRSVQKTTQYLIGAGMAPLIQADPYNGFIYTSFQERATWISHLRTAEQAKEHGDTKLAKICKIISADEKRHEIAYTRVISKVFELDPNGAMLAFEDMMRKKITMPAHLMFDGQNEKLFDDYADVAQRLGVYTAIDYVEIMEHLIDAWRIVSLEGLSSEGMKAQEFVCNLPSRFRKLAERSHEQNERARKTAPAVRKSFSWIFNKEVSLH